jgi:UDP-glucose 4-epimerase
MARPDLYSANNVRVSLALLEAMIVEDVGQLVFASSCAVCGHSSSLAAHG